MLFDACSSAYVYLNLVTNCRARYWEISK